MEGEKLNLNGGTEEDVHKPFGKIYRQVFCGTQVKNKLKLKFLLLLKDTPGCSYIKLVGNVL